MLRMLSLTALILAAVPAVAQNPQPTSPANPTVPIAPPNAPSPPPEKIAPPNGNLSNRLSQQKGTITPPTNVDPGMTVRPPRNGAVTTPVIPPPGSPGGNGSVIPK
jgi:hypothetical protein